MIKNNENGRQVYLSPRVRIVSFAGESSILSTSGLEGAGISDWTEEDDDFVTL